MPPAVAAVAAAGLIGGGLAIGVSTAIGVALVGLGASLALNSISSVLFGKPKIPTAADFTTRHSQQTTVVRSGTAPRQVIYGQRPVSGPLVFASTTSSNRFLHLVVALASHQVQEIGDVFLNDVRIAPDDLESDGNVKVGHAFYNGGSRVRIKKHLGTAGQIADVDLRTEVTEWTTLHRLRGIAYIYVRLRFDRTVFPTGIPNIRAVVRGKKCFDPRDSTTKYTSNPALIVRDFITSSFGLSATASEIDDDIVTASANICDERVAMTVYADTFTLASSPTNTFIFDDPVASEPKFFTGDTVTLSSTGIIPGDIAPGDYFYIRGDAEGKFRLASDYEDAITDQNVISTAGSPGGAGVHTCTLKDQVRYDAHAAILADQKPIDVIEDIMTSMVGVLVYQQGVYKPYAAGADAATVTITESDTRRVQVRARPERRKLFNRIGGSYLSTNDGYEPTDFPLVKNSLYVSQDNGEVLRRDIDLPFTTEPTRAQRIAKIHLERSRQGITVELDCHWTVYQLGVWDTVNLTLPDFGWSAKKFRIINRTLTDDFQGITLVLQEEADGVYDWANGEETTIDFAPDTNLPNPRIVSDVSGLTLSSGSADLLIQGDGTVITRIRVSWTQHPDEFVQSGGEIETQFRRSGAVEWDTGPTAQGDEIEVFFADVRDGDTYDVRVRARNSLGVVSEWNTIGGHIVVGKTEAPGDVDTLTVDRLPDGTRRFQWTQATVDNDVRAGGGYKLRYSTNQSEIWTNMLDLHTGLLPASPHETNQLASGDYRFGIKAVDSSGNESVNAVFNDITLGNPPLQNIIYQEFPHNDGWPGTKTNSHVNYAGALEANKAPPTGDTLLNVRTQDKLFLLEGQFTTTVLDSQATVIASHHRGVAFDGTNTPFATDEPDKLYLQSGQFLSTLITSQDVGAVDTIPTGITSDTNLDTPWCGAAADKLYLTLGQFSSTLITSQAIGSIDTTPLGIDFDGTNTPWAGSNDDKLYLQSGEFSSTLKTSEAVAGIDTTPNGISWDGLNTPWTGDTANKLYLTSGQFSSVLKTSLSTTPISADPYGTGHASFIERLQSGWASLPAGSPSDWSSMGDRWSTVVTPAGEIQYEMAEIDLGADVSATPQVSVTTNGGTVLVEMKTGTSADGSVVGSYVTAANFTGKRYLQIRVTLTDSDPILFQMALLVDGETVTLERNDVDTGMGSPQPSWFESIVPGHFRVAASTDFATITSAKIEAFQNTGPGYSWELLSKAAMVNGVVAAEFKIYDATDTLADATVDITLKGPAA